MTSALNLTIPDLAGKSVLITGASTGIGAALARAFAAQRARVAINYHSSRAAAEALLAEVAGSSAKISPNRTTPTATLEGSSLLTTMGSAPASTTAFL